MKRLFVLLLLLSSALAFAEETYLGMYIQGSKIGYGSTKETIVKLNGKKVKRSDSNFVLTAGMLGSAMSMKMSSTSWYDMSYKPIRMRFLQESNGRSQLTDAVFTAKTIQVTMDNSGTKTKKTLVLPTDAPVMADDGMMPNVGSSALAKKKTFYSFDPTTISLVKMGLEYKGKAKVSVKGKSYTADLVEVLDPRATMKVYVSSKGDIIKCEGPMGIELLPESKKEAMASATGKYQPTTDLAFATSIKADKPINEPSSIKRLVMRITGRDLSRLPTDKHQTVKKEGESWVVDVHPVFATDSVTIAEAAKAQPKWTRPGTHVSSENAQIKALSKKLVANKQNVIEAATAIKDHVYKIMKPNAGIGVLRDCTEILKTKEGVCRDYAILTASLMRAAKIPTRLVSGLVNWDGSFFYHAWVEVWDGKNWIAFDSTTPNAHITATHVKLSQGNVEDAYVFTFLDKVKLEVLSLERK